MHKYQPRVHLVKYNDKCPTASLLADLPSDDKKVFTFSQTQFIGVTAYQNQLVGLVSENVVTSSAENIILLVWTIRQT